MPPSHGAATFVMLWLPAPLGIQSLLITWIGKPLCCFRVERFPSLLIGSHLKINMHVCMFCRCGSCYGAEMLATGDSHGSAMVHLVLSGCFCYAISA